MWSLIRAHNLPLEYGQHSARNSILMSVSPPVTILNLTARRNVSIKNSLDSYDHTAIEISPTGAATFSGPNMLISVRKPATGITPFQCVLGFQPPLFPWSGEPSELPDVDSWLQRSKETWNDESPKSSLSNKGTSQSSSAYQSRLSAKSIFVSGYLARSPR